MVTRPRLAGGWPRKLHAMDDLPLNWRAPQDFLAPKKSG
jgi:hypothetical protein